MIEFQDQALTSLLANPPLSLVAVVASTCHLLLLLGVLLDDVLELAHTLFLLPHHHSQQFPQH